MGSIELSVYTDSAQTEFPQELVADVTKEFTSGSVSSVESIVISLAASGSQSVNLNGASSIKRFYIYSNAADVQVNINGLGNLTCTMGIPGLVPFVTTSLSLTNASSSVATTVTLILIGNT